MNPTFQFSSSKPCIGVEFFDQLFNRIFKGTKQASWKSQLYGTNHEKRRRRSKVGHRRIGITNIIKIFQIGCVVSRGEARKLSLGGLSRLNDHNDTQKLCVSLFIYV